MAPSRSPPESLFSLLAYLSIFVLFMWKICFSYVHIPLVICSDNLPATLVVINSTVRHSADASRLAFYVVTSPDAHADMKRLGSLFPELGKFTVFPFHGEGLGQLSKHLRYEKDNKYINPLNFARMSIETIFPQLSRYIFLDHDIVVREDIEILWRMDLRGQPVSAVEMCTFRLKDIIKYRKDFVERRMNELFPKRELDWDMCIPIAGASVIDMLAWKRLGLSHFMKEWIVEHLRSPLWELGTLPPWALALNGRYLRVPSEWNHEGIAWKDSFDAGIAKIIHYNGRCKPWRPCCWRREPFLEFYSSNHQYIIQNVPPFDTGVNSSILASALNMEDGELLKWNEPTSDCPFIVGSVVLLPTLEPRSYFESKPTGLLRVRPHGQSDT